MVVLALISYLNVFLQQFAVVVQQSSNGVLGQDVVADLLLHEAKVLSNVFLRSMMIFLNKCVIFISTFCCRAWFLR